MEVGVGIHGEPGRKRDPLGTAQEIADVMVEAVVSRPARSGPARRCSPFVNGMGGTPLLELYLLYGEISASLSRTRRERGRSLVGPYITSLEMAGASLTLLELDDELLALWDAPVAHPRSAGGSDAMTDDVTTAARRRMGDGAPPPLVERGGGIT